MLSMFLAWLVATVYRDTKTTKCRGEDSWGAPSGGWPFFGDSQVLLLFSLPEVSIVAGARGIATSFVINEFIIGATIVAVGTSAPELATTVIAKLRGHEEVGLGLQKWTDGQRAIHLSLFTKACLFLLKYFLLASRIACRLRI